MEKGILACLKEDISNVAKQDIIILGLHSREARLDEERTRIGVNRIQKLTSFYHNKRLPVSRFRALSTALRRLQLSMMSAYLMQFRPAKYIPNIHTK